MTVDGATYVKWREAIVSLRRILSVPLIAAGSVPQGVSLPRVLRISGRRLLLELGNACSRTESIDDPARLFGLLRYSRAISRTATGLSLSTEVMELDAHKKAVLSDEFGCAMSFSVARALLGATHFLDFETACRQGTVATAATRRERPDYLAEGGGGVVIVEAKGTQGGASQSRKQVKRGCEQVARVRLRRSAGAPIRARIAVGTALRRDDQGGNTVVHVGDPDEERAVEYVVAGDVRAAIARTHYMRAATLVGDARLLVTLSGQEELERDQEEVGIVRVIGDRPFVGSQAVIRNGDRESGIYVGLSAQLREALLSLGSRGTGPVLDQYEFRSRDTEIELVDAELPSRKAIRTDIAQRHEETGIPMPMQHEEAVEASDGTVLLTWSTS